MGRVRLPALALGMAVAAVGLAGCGAHADGESGGRPDVVSTIPVGETPVAVAAGLGGVWVTNNDDGTVSRIDPRTNRLDATIRVGAYPDAVAVGAGAVWVVARGEGGDINTDFVKRIDPDAEAVTDATKVIAGDYVVGSIAVGAHGVWAVANAGEHVDGEPYATRIVRIDPATRKVVARVDVSVAGEAFDVAAGDTAVWVTGFDSDREGSGTVLRIDPATNRIVARIPLAFPRCAVADSSGVWVTSVGQAGGTISRIEAATNEVAWTAHVGDDPCGIAAGRHVLWAANSFKTADTSDPPVHNRVYAVDPKNGRVEARVEVGPGAGGGPSCPPCAPGPGGIATGDGSVWVITDWWTSRTKNTVTRIAARVGTAR